MTLDDFRQSLTRNVPPDAMTPALTGLWYQGRGDWHAAHEAAQSDDGPEAAWVHAHLHRVEGDEANAGYWYRRAGRPHCRDPLDAEWEAIAATLLAGA
ncbi:hypothetical protein [Thalassobaculum sp.]|uniref:hypothetical protein n=1 Tax=Thalassobaculum sp. TaxID=2022740 RepID=UPI0032EFD27C